ncbi:sensor histidine kinase [Candidatus Margulisiibacteriota bacterium]
MANINKENLLERQNNALANANARAAELMVEIEDKNKIIGKQSEAIAKANAKAIELVVDIEEKNKNLENIQKELNKKNHQLAEFNKLKSGFVSNVAHELKNPLFTIREALRLVINDIKNKEHQKFLTICKNQIARLLRLTSDLLDVEKIESGKMHLTVEEFNLSTWIDEVIEIFRHPLSIKSINLEKNVLTAQKSIQGDKDKLTSVLYNVLYNAIKHTPDNGKIEINVYEKHEHIDFAISDNGPGIPKKDQARIFNKFERVTADKTEGTGLGLPLVKDITELHKGKVSLESEPGKGSTFIFSLPSKSSLN